MPGRFGFRHLNELEEGVTGRALQQDGPRQAPLPVGHFRAVALRVGPMAGSEGLVFLFLLGGCFLFLRVPVNVGWQ